jgi:hypothetical protein
MKVQEDFIKLLIQISIVFGSTITLLLGAILYFIKGKVKFWDDGIFRIDDRINNHETRITVLEKTN